MIPGEHAPYVGPIPFRESDRDHFHGRSHDAQTVMNLWLSTQLLILYGRSGVGKTSLLQAGVHPRLRSELTEGAHVLPLGRVSPGSVPASADPDGNPYVAALLSSWFPAVAVEELAGRSIADVLTEYVNRLDEDRPERRPLLCAIDQFEDLFGRSGSFRGHREELIDLLAGAVAGVPGIHLLLCLGKEHIGDLLAIESALDALPRSLFRLPPLEPGDALEAIRGPLRDSGVAYATGAAETLLDRLRAASSSMLDSEVGNVIDEPIDPFLLQVSCVETWRRRATRGRVERTDVPADIDGSRVLGEYCTRIVLEVCELTGTRPDRLWDWLAGTFITEIGARRAVLEDEIVAGAIGVEVAARLAAHGVLQVAGPSGRRWYELSHDRLVEPIRLAGRPWPGSLRMPEELLREAEYALAAGDFGLAGKRAAEVMALSDDRDGHVKAAGELIRGTLAMRDRRDADAQEHLRASAQYFAIVGDQRAVGKVQANLGRLHLRAGRLTEAISALQSAIGNATGDQALTVDLARALRATGQRRAATAVLSAFLGDSRGAVEVLVERAHLYRELGDDQAASDDFANIAGLGSASASREEAAEPAA
jgi:hypothetical protein